MIPNTQSPIIVSACLAGANCRYNGKNKTNLRIKKLVEAGVGIAVCPEQLGGLTIPHQPAEIRKGSGEDVLDGKAKVLDKEGKDLTDNSVKGAKEVLKIAKQLRAKKAILKSKSPSCGFGQIYDGTFKDRVVEGNGVTAALLARNGFEVESYS